MKLFNSHLIYIALLLVLSTCKFLDPGLGEMVDLSEPEVNITSHINGDYVGGIITLAGDVKDDLGITSVTISSGDTQEGLSVNSGSTSSASAASELPRSSYKSRTSSYPDTPVSRTALTAAVRDESWSLTLDTTTMDDGDHDFIITATDVSGKSVSISLFLIVDNNAPTILITLPAEYGADKEFNKNISIKGEATDSTRVSQVYVSLYDADDDSPVFTNQEATGTSSWYYTFNAETDFGNLDGLYYFRVTAFDNSGNSNSWVYHFDDLLNLANDPGNLPNIEEIHGSDFEGAPIASSVLKDDLSSIRKNTDPGNRIELTVNANSDLPDFIYVSPSFSLNPADNILSTPQRLSGFVEDDDGINYSTLKVSIWNIADNPLTDPPLAGHDNVSPAVSGNQWSYDINLPDGEYKFKLTVDDIYGTTGTSDPGTFKVSSFAPVVNVTAPSQGTYVGTSSVVDLQVQVSGMSSGTVEVDPNGDADYSDAITMTNDGGGTWSVSLAAGTDFTVLDGEQLFRVRAGTSGNYGLATLQYTGDISKPVVEIQYPVAGLDLNGEFNIAGTSSDNNIIDAVYLWIDEVADPGDNPPADLGSWLSTDGTNLYNWIKNLDTVSLNPGNHIIHLAAVDAAGNLSDPYSLTFNVDQESDRPVISFSNLIEGASSLENSLGRDDSIIGSITDDDNIDASTVMILIDIYNDGSFSGEDLDTDGNTTDANESEQWTIVSSPPGADGRIVNWSHSLLNLPQGEHSMQLRVHDVNSSGVNNEAANPNYTETLETVFMIDYGPPDLIINQPANNSLFRNPFIISGTASDANGVFDVQLSLNGGSFFSVMSDPSGEVLADWSYNFPVSSDGSDDGDYSYQIQAVDMSGGKTILDRQVTVDATAPTIIIEQPADGSSINGDSVTIRGTADDNRDISSVYIDINPFGISPESDPLLWDYQADGTYSWNRNFNSLLLNGSAASAPFVISLMAVDNAGNQSAVYTSSVSIDQTTDRPQISFNDIDKNETDASNNVLVGATTLTGIIEDDDLIDPALFSGNAIEISIDAAPWEAVSNPPASSAKVVVWKHSITSLTEGPHTVKVRVRDNQSDGTIADSSADAQYTADFNWNIEDSADQSGIPFILNLGPPTILINTPSPFSYHNSDVLISGTATDANGVASVEISVDNGASWEPPLPITPGSLVNWNYSFTVPADGTKDGTVSYMIRAIDDYGSTSIENAQFTVDATLPETIINRPSDTELVNGDLILSGTASDNINLSTVHYNLQLSSIGTEPAYPADYTLLTGKYSWSQVINTTDLADDDYTLRIVPLDSAGNQGVTNSVDFTVDQTSDRPIISLSSITEGGGFTDNLLPVSKQVTGSIIDDDAVDVSTIQYRLYEDDGTTLISDWAAISNAPASDTTLATWSHTFSGLTDGKYQAQFRASDKFDGGNFTAGGFGWSSSGLVKFAVDTANPETTIDSPAANGGYINQDFTVSGTASDDGGIKRIDIQFGSEAVINLYSNTVEPYLTDRAWTTVFDVDEAGNTDDGILDYTITLTDAYDKQKIYERYITIDTVDPVVNSLELVNNDQTGGTNVNGSVLIQGTPVDNETLVSAVYFLNASSVPPEPGTDPTAEGWELLGSTTNINKRFDSSAAPLTDNTDYTSYIIVEDLAGNRTAVADYSVDFHTQQSGNIPVITLDTPADSLLWKSDSISGSISDDDGVDVSTIMLSFNGGTDWVSASAASAANSTNVVFSHSLADVDESAAAYTVLVKASDIGEDFTDDTQDIPAEEGQSSPLSIYVDDSAPTASITNISNGQSNSATIQGIYINNRFTITGTAADTVGILDVRAKLSIDAGAPASVTPDVPGDYTSWSWGRSGLAIAADSVGLTLEVEDIHHRLTTYNYTILVDSTKPEISFITGSDTYHGQQEIRGSSSDNILVTKVFMAQGTTLPAAPAGGNPETDVNYTQLGSTYTWSTILDTMAIHPVESDLNYYISVVAVDGAGNVSDNADLALVINQGDDRPILSFSNITGAAPAAANLLESNAKILGAAEDDDGLSSILISTSGDNSTFSAWTAVTTDGSTPFSISGPSVNWQSYVADLGEGVHYVKFKVIDTEYIDDGTTPFNFLETSSEAITIDTGAPSLNITDFDIDNPYAGPITISKTASAGMLINNSFTINGTAIDGNTVSSVQIKTDNPSFDTYVNVQTLSGADWSHKFSFARDGSLDGTLTIYVTATDEFSKSTTTSIPVTIDTQEPIIIPTQPSGLDLADPPNLNGPATLRGSITEVSGINTFTAVGGTASDVILNNSGSDLNWVIDLDTDLYANSSYAVETDPGVSNIWRFPINMSAEDKAGNIGLKELGIDIDPNSDKPQLYLSTPAADSSVAGAFIVQGTVTDDDAVQKVTIQVDLDDDGNYTSIYDLDGTAAVTDFENESIPVDISVSNGSWSILMNQSNELSVANLVSAGYAGATGWIRLKVTPYDQDNSRSGSVNLAGESTEIRIYIDSTAPIIEGQGQALPSPSSGSIVKETVTLEARFKDDQILDTGKMQISYDGGVGFQSIEAAGGTVTGPALVSGFYEYDIDLPINTTDAGGIISGGNGILQMVLKVTDETYKQNSISLQLNVDNTLPTGIWNYNSDLPDQAGLYTFYGNAAEGGEYLLIGSAEDTGTISGVEKIDVFFVKNGNFYSPIDGTPLSTTGNTASVADMTGNSLLIPFPPSASYDSYVISIDNRAERGIYDLDSEFGDDDGFEESLRSKGTYEEWFAYFNSKVFPDGPMDIYYLVYDTVGNISHELVDAQISNNPPVISEVKVGGSAGTANPYTGLFKASTSLYIDINATDVEGINTGSYKAILTNKVVAPNGAVSSLGPALNTEWSPDSNGILTLDIQESTAFVSGIQYTLTLQVNDTDGNLTSTDIEFWLDNNDSTLPKVDIDPFTQDHLSGLNGHLEEDGNSLIDGIDADISGTIKISGTAWDDNTVSAVELSFDGGTTWTAVDSVVSGASDPILGTDYSWSYVWDTTDNFGAFTADAAYNRTIMVRATDSNANIGTLNDSGSDPTMSVDVVPYITQISGTGFDSGLLQYVKRSAAGKYPIVVGSEITISGYNLPGTASGSLVIGGGTPLTAASATGTTQMVVPLGTTETSGEIVVTTDSVPSSNNSNDNALSQNQESNLYNPNLRDDREAVFWDISSLSGTSTVSDPFMHPNSGDNAYDWMYVRSGKDLFYKPGLSAEKQLSGGTGLRGGSFTYNSSGTLMFLFNHNSQWSFSDSSYRYMGSVQWGAIPNLGAYSFTEKRDEAYNWNQNQGIPRLGVGNVSFADGDDFGGSATLPTDVGSMDYGYSKYDLNRYENLKIKTIGTDSVTRNYVAYFDSGAGESRSIVFYGYKTGTSVNDVKAAVNLANSSKVNTDLTYLPLASSDNIATNNIEWYANLDKHYMVALDYDVALSGTQDNNDNGIATPRGRQEVTAANSGNDSAYFDLAVHAVNATTHYGYIAFFDESSQSLKITANESLYTADPTGTLGSWTTPAEIDTNAGAFVSMATDSNGGIHLAYQDVSAGYLKYAYLTYNSVTDEFTTVKKVLVDALFGAGTNNSIAVRDFGSDERPVILTFSNTFTGTIAPLRMSYPLKALSDSEFNAGANGDGTFTGKWETIALPAGSNPENSRNFLYVNSNTDQIYLGYKGNNLEEAEFKGF